MIQTGLYDVRLNATLGHASGDGPPDVVHAPGLQIELG
jgi:hypothetical protein